VTGVSDVIDAGDVANGIAVTVQHHDGHGLLSLELLYFVSQLPHLSSSVFWGSFCWKSSGLAAG
jgi:hypothetical protein